VLNYPDKTVLSAFFGREGILLHMKDTRPIEEQVAELTEEQKDNILKVDKYAMIIAACASLPIIAVLIIVLLGFVDKSARYRIGDAYLIALAVICVLTFAVCIGAVLFIRSKYPYYSDNKSAYIKKNRKDK